jgi:hypothetical protein
MKKNFVNRERREFFCEKERKVSGVRSVESPECSSLQKNERARERIIS